MSTERHSIQSWGFGTIPCLPGTTQSHNRPEDQFEKSIMYFWVQVVYTAFQWLSRYIWHTTDKVSIPASFAT